MSTILYTTSQYQPYIFDYGAHTESQPSFDFLIESCIQIKIKRLETWPAVYERKCKISTKDDIGDEYHHLFTCDYFTSDRKLYLKPYFYVKPNIRKYRELSTSTNEATLIKLSKFVAIIMEKFSV